MSKQRAASSERPVVWRWSFFLLGVIYSVPAMAVVAFDPTAGLALAVGVMPVAALGLPGHRKDRRVIPVVGVLSAVGFVLGSLLTQVPTVAVVALFVLAIGCTLWARHGRAGALVLALVLPLTGIALSYSDLAQGAFIAVLVLAGSLYAWGVATPWPEWKAPVPVHPATPSRSAALTYGVLLGSAAAIAATLGYVLGLEHVGWATGAVLLVMRPTRDQVLLRSVGRTASVTAGALAAVAVAAFDPPVIVVAVLVGSALATMAATQGSRWYIAPAFTTFLVLTLILQGAGEQPGLRFAERTLETLAGVGLALLFGAVIPASIMTVRTMTGGQRQI